MSALIARLPPAEPAGRRGRIGEMARTAAAPVGPRLPGPGDPRRTISVVHRTGDRSAPAAEAFRAPLRGASQRRHDN
ncbi:hypothetical protein ACGFY3_10410 [Streptomyces mirabilis]|uniref:hypothetical protein n=1 Tax=Streptomyces mirabilis TaxID=68239 RepID=UPI00372092C5